MPNTGAFEHQVRSVPGRHIADVIVVRHARLSLARVGSTNLNLTSWIGNWELDVAVEDEAFAKAMEEMYLDDLSHATEVVLTARGRVV